MTCQSLKDESEGCLLCQVTASTTPSGLIVNITRLKAAYNFNFATNVAMGAFNNHEITLGINIGEYLN